MKNDLYDSLATECGEAVNETVKTVTGNEVMQELKKVDKTVNSYAYGSSGPIPGDTIESYLDDVANVNKEDAISNLVAQSALLKAKSETEQNKSVLTKEEKARQKKQFVDYMMYQQEEAYFTQNHYIMDGKTKRRIRKMIERNYDKGRYGSLYSGKSLND